MGRSGQVFGGGDDRSFSLCSCSCAFGGGSFVLSYCCYWFSSRVSVLFNYKRMEKYEKVNGSKWVILCGSQCLEHPLEGDLETDRSVSTYWFTQAHSAACIPSWDLTFSWKALSCSLRAQSSPHFPTLPPLRRRIYHLYNQVWFQFYSSRREFMINQTLLF